jgi:tape measure domain-containing protein
MATLSNNDIKIRYVVETSNIDAAAQAFDKLSTEEKQALAELKKFNQESNNTNKSMGELGSIAGKVGGVLGGLFAVSQIKQFAAAVLETTIKFESMKKAIDFASGSAEMGNKNFEFIRQTAQKLGLDLRGAVEGYKTFASAANLAGQTSQETNRQFAAVAKAAQVMGLSAEDTKGAFLALGQMMSKGNVQAEELRGQLGERLVGAFGIAAKAMGVTTGELNKMLQKGQVLAADFLPKFATELENTFGKGNEQVTSLAASQNRFNSSIDQLILAIGNKLNPFLKGAYDLAAGIATELSKAGGTTAAERQAKFNAEAVAQKRIETELTKETIKLDQQNQIRITAANLEGIRRQIARNQLLTFEARIDAQMQKVSEARIAAAGTMNSRLQMNLTKQENELKILQAMEEQYTKIVGVVANAPTLPQPIDPKVLKAEYEQRLNILELLKQMRILEGELRNDPLARLGAEKAFLEAKLNLQRRYGALFVKEELDVTKLQVQVATKEFETGANRQLIIRKEANVKILEEDKNLYDKRLAEMKKWQKAYEQGLDDEAKKRKEAEDEKQRRIQATIELAATLTNGFTNLYTANIDREISLLNKRADEEIRLADGNQQKIDEINQRKAQKERELKTKAWKAEQAAAIARVIFETASIVAKWASNPVTLPLAALTLANQAVQIGFIAAQPVPEFAEGTKGKPFEGGRAIVGERGVEKVVTESGKVYFTPATATLVDLPKGSQVIPNHALSRQELFLAGHYANKSSSGSSPVVGKLDELSSILKSLPITQLNMDERGFEKFIRTPRRTTKILNNRFRNSS